MCSRLFFFFPPLGEIFSSPYLLSRQAFVICAAMGDSFKWIDLVLLGKRSLKAEDVEPDNLETVALRFILITDNYLWNYKEIADAPLQEDLPVIVQTLLRTLKTLYAAHAQHSIKERFLNSWLQEVVNPRMCSDDAIAIQTDVDDVTRWLVSMTCQEDIQRCANSAISLINSHAMLIVTKPRLKQRIFWNTLVILAPYAWTRISLSIHNLLLRPWHDPVLDTAAWWFFDTCAPLQTCACSEWTTDQIFRLITDYFWHENLTVRMRLIAYLVQYGAVLPVHYTIPSNIVLHLFTLAIQDRVLAVDILALPESMVDALTTTTWPAHAWMCDSLHDGSAMLCLLNSEPVMKACGAHLWQVWRTQAHVALIPHMISDLANLTLGYLQGGTLEMRPFLPPSPSIEELDIATE
jgi:hypothetical protein